MRARFIVALIIFASIASRGAADPRLSFEQGFRPRLSSPFARAAELLDLQRSNLHQKAGQYGLERPKKR